MNINPDFRTRLEMSIRGDRSRAFKPLPAGPFRMSIQPSPLRTPNIIAPEDCDRWEVALFTPDGKPATPQTHPRLFQNELWGRYWSHDPAGGQAVREVPTEVVQTFHDFLVLGLDRYQEMTSMQ